MDNVDRKILEELEEDARKSFTEIAEEVNVSEGTVRNRVEKMKDEGEIRSFTVERGLSSVQVFVSVEVSTERKFQEVVSDFPEDLEAYEVAGDIDMLLKISRETSEEVNKAIDRIRAVEGVEDTKTYMVLSRN